MLPEFRLMIAGKPCCDSLESRRMLASALPNIVYAPDGYAAPHIEEFLNIVNPHPVAVVYEVWIHYETDRPSELVKTAIIAPLSRGGETMSSPRLPELDIPDGVPYSIELGSSAPLVANLTRYDRGTVGETLTGTSDTRWSLMCYPLTWDGVEYLENVLAWFNPTSEDAEITMVFTSLPPNWVQGEIRSVTRNVASEKRGGLILDLVEELKDTARGAFSIDITSTQPIIVSYSQYEAGIGSTMEMGVPGPGAAEVVIPYVEPHYPSGGGATSSGPVGLYIVNMSETQAATIDITYYRDDGTVLQFDNELTLTPGNSYDLIMAYLGDFDDTPNPIFSTPSRGSLRITSNEGAPLKVLASTGLWPDGRDGDLRTELVAARAMPVSEARSRVLLSEGFMLTERAGTSLFTTVSIYVPESVDTNMVDVTVRILLGSGVQLAPETFSVESGSTLQIDMHEYARLLEAGDDLGLDSFVYAVEIAATIPVLASMRHDDHFFGNGDGSFLINAMGMEEE